MKNTLLFIAFIGLIASTQGQEKNDDVNSEPKLAVTVENYARAETDFQMVSYQKNMNCFSKLVHQREFYSVDNQLTVRVNRDTYYSFGFFDLKSPVTIVKPESSDRFQSLMLIDQDHSILPTIYDAGTYVFTQESIGSRYLQVIIRTFVDANDPEDVKKAHDLQDQIKIIQVEKGKFEVPNWDQESRKKMMDAINVLAESMPTTRGFFGDKSKLDPLKHLMGTAYGYGGNPDEDAVYSGIIPEKNDGDTVYSLTVKDVPVDGFWSITVYNAEGYMEKNKYNSYSTNNKIAKRNEDGSITINFGGDPKQDNYLYTFENWNYLIRLYQPHQEIIDGTWEFPKLQEFD